ncbi:hypothetical protein Ocin01_03663 [Orchesella cincta]|uniref:Uncharacterized protein n=1 Tax=Orchesella cincta TaxID=48709 RepID=A0A1D2NCN5_ORCCI|nr:hypothetical protein Ocin01_03663 [Orchesella cincta]
MASKKSVNVLESDLNLSEDSDEEIRLQIHEEEQLLADAEDRIGLRVQLNDGSSTSYTNGLLSTYFNVELQGTQSSNRELSAAIPSTSRGLAIPTTSRALQTAPSTENMQYEAPDDNNETMEEDVNVVKHGGPSLPPPATLRSRPNELTTSKGFQRFGGVQRNICRNSIRTRVVQTNRPQNEWRQGRLRETIKSAMQGNPSTDEEQNRLQKNLDIPSDPWSSIVNLGEKGYHIFWQLSKLRKEYVDREDLKGRTFRCMIKLEDIVGICESSGLHVARSGAAINFLQKFTKKFPPPFGQGTSLPTKLEKIFLMPGHKSFDCFRQKYYEKHNTHFTYKFDNKSTKVSDKTVYTDYLWIGDKTYEGRCISSSILSRCAAVLAAYEDIMQEQFPLESVFLDDDVRKSDEGLFKIESQTTHSHDFTLYDKKQPSDIRTPQINTFTGRGRARDAATVSYIEPSNHSA